MLQANGAPQCKHKHGHVQTAMVQVNKKATDLLSWWCNMDCRLPQKLVLFLRASSSMSQLSQRLLWGFVSNLMLQLCWMHWDGPAAFSCSSIRLQSQGMQPCFKWFHSV